MKIKYIYMLLLPPEKNDEFDIPKDLFYNSKTNQILKSTGFELSDNKLFRYGLIGAGIGVIGIPKLPINFPTILITISIGFWVTFFIIQKILLNNSEVIEVDPNTFDLVGIEKYRIKLLKVFLISIIIVISGILIVIYLLYQFDSAFFFFFLFLLGCALQVPSFFFWDILTGKALKLIKKNYLPNGKVEE